MSKQKKYYRERGSTESETRCRRSAQGERGGNSTEIERMKERNRESYKDKESEGDREWCGEEENEGIMQGEKQ